MKSFFILTVLISTFLFFGTASASELFGATCTVTAEVVDKGSEMKKVRVYNSEVLEERESKYVRLGSVEL